MPPEVSPAPLLTEWQDTVRCFFQAMIPALFLPTYEEQRLLDQLIGVVQWLGGNSCGYRTFTLWSEVSTREFVLFKKDASDLDDDDLQIKESDSIALVPTLLAFAKPEQAKPAAHAPQVLVLCDPTPLNPASRSFDPVACRALKETINAIRGSRKTVVLLSAPFVVTEELQNEVIIVPFELPTSGELYAVAKPLLDLYKSAPQYKNKVTIEEASVAPFARACAGITEQEMRSLISLSMVRFQAFDKRAVTLALKEKERIVKRSDTLEAITPDKDLSAVGGLENVKSWVVENEATLRNPEAARKYGTRLPSGLLLAGIPGCGKTLTAKALAGQWKVPLLICDVGKLFGSFVGESEKNVRKMIGIANACRPCIVFIDEFEKALGGDSQDGGATSRVKSTLLSWMSDKSDEVFIVATANDLTKLNANPEFLRRFDQTFFVDLPDLRSRVEILSIHLLHPGQHVLPAEQLIEIAKRLKGYSGAEIAKVVQRALRLSLSRSLPHPTMEIIVQTISSITPLKDTMKEPIHRLRQWCRDGRATPAGATLEDDERSDAKSLIDDGFPDIVGPK